MLINETRAWISPTLCGCKINLTADWRNPALIDADGNLTSYAHPRPFTITRINIVNVCSEHEHYLQEDIPENPYGDRIGYIKLPINNPTPAEKLYIQLYKFASGPTKLDTCDCQIHMLKNTLTGEEKIIEHPIYTVRCKFHSNDTKQLIALTENQNRQSIIGKILETHPDFQFTDIKAEYDDSRILKVESLNEEKVLDDVAIAIIIDSVVNKIEIDKTEELKPNG